MVKPAEKPKKRRKPARLRKTDFLRIRVTADQKRVLMDAAESDGSDLSSWMLALAMRQARVVAAQRTAAGQPPSGSD